MPASNPYLNRQPVSQPDEFFGRGRDVRWLLERIMHPSVPQCCSITGLRRIGKSSLLRFLEYEDGARAHYPDYFAGQERAVLVYVDLSRHGSELEEDSESLARSTLRHILQALVRKARRRLPPEVAGPLANLLEQSDGSWQSVLEAVDEALYLLNEQGYRVIFLLDEMDVAAAWHPRLAQALRALVMEYQVAYVTASLDPLFELLDEGRTSPLYNLFSSRPLGLLEPEEAEALLTLPAQKEGVVWSERLVARVLEAVGGHPDLVKRAASHLWDLQHAQAGEPEWEMVLDALRPDAEALFTSIWDHLDPEERRMVVGLAMGHALSGEGNPLLPTLQQRAILTEATQGARLFGSLFADWVRRRDEGTPRSDEPRLEGRWLHINNNKTQLTPTEVKLARALLRRRGHTVTREELQRSIWEDDLTTDSKALDTAVQRLRGKIEADRNNPQWLITVRGEGYLFK